MRAQEILGRGIQETKFQDKTYSTNGRPDFTPDQPEIISIEPKGPNSRPRSKASTNNSYT